MTLGLQACDRPLSVAYDLALVDLDGVAYRGHLPIDGAAPALAGARAAGMRVLFVTNNASREPQAVADQLEGLGIAAQAREVLTAAQAAALTLRTRLEPGAKVLVVGAQGLRTAVVEEGFVIVDSADDRPEAVVQGFGPQLAWADLAEASYAVAAGAWYVASNLDKSLPTARGYAPGNGALVAAVVAATGVVPDSSGKPSPDLYRIGVERAGGRRPLVVGDRLDTDLAGARAGGFPGLHVLTGVSSGRDDVLAGPHERPTFVGADLRALLDPHPAPVLTADGWWVCRQAGARVNDGVLELHGDPGDLDVLRAACGAAWATVDAGGVVDASTVPELGPRPR
ncbi:MAG: HAD-IIA family hydrolase [Actinobacteria bacterium]|nr:HAD-IIA family hydrolase [Actinomycetota bacterium]